MDSKRPVITLHDHTAPVNGVAFSLDGKFLATGSWDNTVRLRDATKYRFLHKYIGHTDRVTSVAFSCDSKTLVSSAGPEVKLWDIYDRKQNPHTLAEASGVEQRRAHRGLLFAHGYMPEQLIMDRRTHMLTLIDLMTGRALHRWPISDLFGAAISSDGQLFALGHKDGSVTLHNAVSGMKILQLDGRLTSAPGDRKEAGHLAFSADGKRLAVVTTEPAHVTVWDLPSGRLIGSFQDANSAEGIAFSPNGKLLAVATWRGYVFLWDLDKHQGEVQNRDLVSWPAHSKPVTDVAFSPDGKTLATASDDKTVKLWNIATRREMVTLKDQASAVLGVGFSRKGEYLTSAGWDGAVLLYSATQLGEADGRENH